MKVTPVNATGFEFISVNVRVDVPLTAIGFGEKALVIVGGFGVLHPVKLTSSSSRSDPGFELPELNP